MKPYQLHPAQILRHNALYLAIISALYPSFSAANPSGAQVISGQVSIDQSVSGVTTIKNSPNAIINWQNFNIAKNEITQFIQQNGQSAVLNRIVGGNPSEILGSLYSNGKVFLINPNGIVFGAGSQIDTQGLLASSLNLSDNDFQKGNFHFIAGSKAGDIANEGIIHAGKDGNIVLVAPNIQNSGIIKSEGGKIVLAAGQELILTNMDDPEIRFQVQAPKNHVLNVGQLLTEGGSINVFAGSIKHSGDISADSVEIDKQGNIRLVAKADVTLEKDSTISANNEKGVAGKIEVTGENVALLDNSKLEAVGEKGGGEILVGGDYQGKNAAVQNAQNTVVAEKVEIKADATTEGDGGKVVVWSDNETKVAATFSAKGGKKSGDGGLVETSGKKLNIADTTKVSTIAPKGKSGTWLLDPLNFTIAAGSGTQTNANIGADTLSANLGSGNVTIATDTTTGTEDGDIFVNAPVSWSTNKLTLNAQRNIEINAALDGGTTGGLELIADTLGSITATAAVNVGTFTLTNGGWSQIGSLAPLPSFSATDFRITGGTFFRALGGGGVAINPNQITDVYGLQGMKGFLSSSFSLANNIDAAGTSGWNAGAGFEPVGNYTTRFTGQFDGLGHTITNLTINRPSTSDYVALFGVIDDPSIVDNIGMLNVNIIGNSGVGALVGYNPHGTVNRSYSTGSVSGTTYVGGLVGDNNGTINDSYSLAAVSGSDSVGGLVGYNGTSTNGASINRSYSTGSVNGSTNIGGLIGYQLLTGTVTNSFWDTDTSGQTTSEGGTGLTTTEMKNLANFTTATTANGNVNPNWDFTNTWKNFDGYSKPYLAWQQAFSGTIDGATASKNIKYAIDGAANTETIESAADGFFYKIFPNSSSVQANSNLLVWLSGDANKAAVLTNSDALTDLKLELDTIYGTKNLDTATLETAKGSLLDTSIPYSFNGLTLRPTVTNLKANNDVTINHNLTRDGESITLVAGRSINVEANKSIDVRSSDFPNTGGNISITANADITNDGIQNVHRSIGDAVIEMQTGSGLNTGLGVGGIAILMRRNSDKSYNDAGTITLSNTVSGNNVNIDNADTLHGGSAADEVILNGTFSSTGISSISANRVTNAGTINIGGANAIGTLNINGDFYQQSSGILNVDLASTINSTNDSLTVTGTADLDGAIHVSLFNGFTPQANDSFTFLTAHLINILSSSGNLNAGSNYTFAGGVLTYSTGAGCSVGYSICFVGGTNWNTNTNWSTGNLPSSSDDVEINGNYNVVLDVSAFVQSLNISGSSSLKVDTTSSNTLDTTNGISGTGTLIYKISNIIPATLPAMTIDNLTFSSDGDLTVHNAFTFNGAGTLTFEYGQGSSTGGTSNYYINAPVNLPNATTFSTKLGSSGGNVDYSVITTLGLEGDESNSTCGFSLQGQGCSDALGGNFVLGADINASATSGWNSGAGFAPIGDNSSGSTATRFTGKFDGLGHTISNLTINRPMTDYVGLFGYAGSGSEIRNVGLLGGSVVGNQYVGGIAGIDYGGTSISNVFNTGTVFGNADYVGGLTGTTSAPITHSFATGNVTGSSRVGGLTGQNFEANTISLSYATGNVIGVNWVGGIVGDNNGSLVTNSYAIGSVTGSNYVGGLAGVNSSGTITNSWSSGMVSGLNGGLVGGVYGFSTTTNSFWDKQTSGQETSAGGTGLTTAEMTHATNFTGFNFSGTWSIQEGSSYPYLTSIPLINRPSLLSWGGSNCVTGVCFYPTDTNNLYDWNTALNWNTNTIPDANSSVYLSGFTGTVYYTDLTSSIAALTIGAGVGLDLSSTGTATALNISGTSLINGSLNVNNSTFAPASGITGSGSINYDVTGDLALPLITAHSVSVSASGNVTQTAPITATNLSLLGLGNYTLTNNNVIGTLAAGIASNKIGSLNFVNSGDLTIGSIGTGDGDFVQGVKATGEVSIATQDVGSNLRVNQPVSTTSTSLSAVKLNAGSIETTTTTGNIIFGTNGGVSVGVGGRAELYSGSISGTTLPSGLIPAGNFRYNSDESIAHYTAPITAAGNYAIYREQPTLTVTPSVSSMTYGDTSPTLIPSSYSGMKNGDTDAQIFVTTPTLTIGGAKSTSGNYAAGNHSISSNAVEQLGYLVNYGSFTVSPKNLAITATGNNKTYDSTTSATVNLADDRILDDVFTTSYGSASFANPDVGTAKPITVSGIGISGTDASNYTFNTTTTTSADITAAVLHAISLSGSRVYDGTTAVNAGIFTLSGLQGSDDLTLSGAGTITDKNVGTNKSVSLGTLALGNGSIGLASNYTFAGGTYTVNITPAPLSITATPVIKVYGNVDPQLTYTASGLIGSDSLAGTLTRTAGENIGQYPITIGSLNNPNYTISYTPADFTITAAALALAITADNQTRLYGAVNPTFTGKITNGQLKNGDTLESLGLSFSTTATPTSGVGNYPITPAITNTNYVFTGNNGTLAITPASLSVTANAVSKKFGEVDPNLTFTSSGLIGNDALVGNLSRESGENVGNYAISQGSLANPNYNISYTGANFTINPVALNLAIQADSKTRLYGASNPIFTGTIAEGSLQNGDTLDFIGLTFSTDATATSNVGNYQIIPALTNQNYIFTGTNGVLSVTPASLTVTANTLSKIYGETDPALTYSVSGLIGNDALAGNLSRASGENAGNYAITQGSLANPNYNISYTGANFTINPAILNLAIQADSKTRLYGASNPMFTGTITAGALQNGETLDSIGLTFNTDATSTSNVGTYQIIPVLTNQNYIFTSTNGILSVTPASLTVTANALSKIYGEIDPVLTYSVSGLIGNDALAGNLSRASGENVGNYAITQGNLANPNYTLNYVGAELGISPANLTITANPQSKTFGEADPTLTFSIQGLIGEDKLTGELSRIEGETVKTYEITSNDISAGDNYKLSYIPNSLTINRAPKITWISQTDNQWQNAANWNQGVLPDLTQDVSIPNTSFNIDMAGTINVNSLFSLASLHLVDGASVNVTNPFTLQIGTVLSGNGSFITPQFINNGTFSPGNSPGAIGIAGDFIQTESGLLKMEIQDETPSGYDQLNISGDATLNGTIKLVSLNGYKPSPNFQPKFLSASGGFSGLFNRIDNSESPALNYKFNFVDGQLITALLPDSFEYESIIRNLADDANQAEFIISEVEKGTDSQMNTVITMSPQQTTFVTEEELKKNNNLVSVVEKGSTTFANKSTKTLGVCQ
jgi:filamentous hemagglutinin family protein